MHTMKENQKRYEAAMHAVQSGVAQDHARGSDDGTPKHLRVGVNSALVNNEAIARILIAKGVMTMEEYYEEVANCAEREKLRYETLLSKQLGVEIKLA